MKMQIENENMYCSDLEYDSGSEQGDDVEVFGYESDDYDGKTGNLDDYELRTVIPEAPSRHYFVHFPIQLAAMSSEYSTIEEGCKVLHETIMEKEKEEREQRLKEFEEFLVQEEKERRKWFEFLATLPTESEDGKAKRLEKMKKELEEKLKEKKKKGNVPLPFPHRRNGGGKHSNKEPATKEVIKARRASRRAENKKTKKKEEEERSQKFAVEPVKKVEEKPYLALPPSKNDIDNDEIEDIKTKTIEAAMANEKREKEKEKEKEEFEMNERERKEIERKEVESWTEIKRKKQIEPIILKMGAASYIPSPAPPVHSCERTRICNSVVENRKCPHGEKCRFAHSLEELNLVPCRFGDKCKLVCFEDSYKNVSKTTRVCKFSHPEETKINYAERVGITIPKSHVAIPQPVVPKPPVPPAQTVVAKLMIPPSPKVSAWKNPLEIKEKPLCKSVGTGKPCPHGEKCRFRHPDINQEIKPEIKPEINPDEVVITIPLCMAQQAVEMIMTKGLTNVRLKTY
jgi:hypothetical protein